jgi:putative hydrolase of the HAD superfamily
MSQSEIVEIAFDLDDTLFDTSEQLVPKATTDAFTAMIAAGLLSSESKCWEERTKFILQNARQGLFAHLVAFFGVRNGVDPDEVVATGYHVFHEREVPEEIELFPGAADLLASLKTQYVLHLVTSGTRPTQERKIEILKIAHFFQSIHHVDPSRGQRKREAFSQIQSQRETVPQKCLSVGNRLDSEIADAKELGWLTCWMRHGEYSLLTPQNNFEIPDFEITQLVELRSQCRL